ncbi:histidinol dehydrogenase [Actinomadura fibrosa]|uniref:Histidinol dehydrogenase n=1 Tax=Actinomadura fibrosa TaxID=111802 RepID=A0ABW2XSQ2_9ACTN|nr:histidinol dehydrogenase [Actinomadura fibrosa]
MRVPAGDVTVLKRPLKIASSAVDPQVRDRVSEMLSTIERDGMDAVRRYSRELDGWDPGSFAVTAGEAARATAGLDPRLRESIDFAIEQVAGFAARQLATLTDFEAETLPGVVLGQKQIPLAHVGAYAPAGRVPMLASPFMTVKVPKVAGVDRVVACTPPRAGQGVHAPTLYSLTASGADAVYCLGGVQAVAAMAFGLLDGAGPVDKLVGPGNAFVAEAKRQLYGQVGIDMIAGPSEVAVIADDSADPELVAADLLGQAEHGPTSPAALVTTSRAMADAVLAEIDRQLGDLARAGAAEVPGAAWRDYGFVLLAADHDDAVRLSDLLAAEHLEVHTDRDDWYLKNLRNYGSLFVGQRATVAFSDKAIGTNHVLPTANAGRYTGGLSVASFLKTVTWQRIDTDEGVRAIAPHVVTISQADLMPAHEATAAKRLERLPRA